MDLLIHGVEHVALLGYANVACFVSAFVRVCIGGIAYLYQLSCMLS